MIVSAFFDCYVCNQYFKSPVCIYFSISLASHNYGTSKLGFYVFFLLNWDSFSQVDLLIEFQFIFLNNLYKYI